MSEGQGGNLKVVVRCRPLNSREKARGATHLVDIVDQCQLVLNPQLEGDSKEGRATKKKPVPFSFDRMFGENTCQNEVFDFMGIELIDHAFAGFNTCVFAYGQTGSGKSHSMVGYAAERGLIPLTCSHLFDQIQRHTAQDPHLTCSVEVSYFEIYNEKVHDLLNPKNKSNLKVREHPIYGPYVEDLSKLVVKDFDGIEHLMDEGNKARTVAATNMNATSSRSHAVITLVLTQKRLDPDTKAESEKVSRISLVDLAGSERANSTGATGARLKEGANINRSLTTLGKVIAALAKESDAPVKPKKKGTSALDSFVPYRDSVLTWLLKDSLGGNSKTAMIAAISPADYEETLSTLRYADQAKKIQNKAVVNEDPNAKLIRQLKEELEMLRARAGIAPGTRPLVGAGGSAGSGAATSVPSLGGPDGVVQEEFDPSLPPEQQIIHYQTASGEVKTVNKQELQEQMEENEKLVSSLQESWEQKINRTQQIHREREKALEAMGITIDKANIGVHTPQFLPHLVNLNEDPLMSECLIYQIKPGPTVVCRQDDEISNVPELEPPPDQAWASTDSTMDEHEWGHIRLSGTRILPRHSYIYNDLGKVTIEAVDGSLTIVNGKRLVPGEKKRLHSGYRVILGDVHVFRFNHPEEARRARGRMSTYYHPTDPSSVTGTAPSGPGTTATPSTPATSVVPATGDAATADGASTTDPITGATPGLDDVDDQDWDWTAARREAALAALKGEHISFEKFQEDELDRLFDDVQKAHLSKRMGSTGNGPGSGSMSPATPPVRLRPTNPEEEAWGTEWDGMTGLGLGASGDAAPPAFPQNDATTGAAGNATGTGGKATPSLNSPAPASVPELAREAFLLKAKVREYEAQLGSPLPDSSSVSTPSRYPLPDPTTPPTNCS